MSDDHAQVSSGWTTDFHAPVTDQGVDDPIELTLSARAPVVLEEPIDCTFKIDPPPALDIDTEVGADRQRTVTVEPGEIHEVRWICHATEAGSYTIDGRVHTPDVAS